MSGDGKVRLKMSLKHVRDIQVEFLRIDRLMLRRDSWVGNKKKLSF